MTRIEKLELERLMAILDRDYRRERELAAEIGRAQAALDGLVQSLWPGAIMPETGESGYDE